ncbi:MAG: 50S ribosomal protein L18 [Chloroflexota bacterium]
MGKIEPRQSRLKRHRRIRLNLKGTTEQPRLCVFRSLNHIYAQVIDDSKGQTLVSASTLDHDVKGQADGKGKAAGDAGLVGTEIAKRALSKGIKQVAFDRGGYQYHGRVKALAEAARKAGLKF